MRELPHRLLPTAFAAAMLVGAGCDSFRTAKIVDPVIPAVPPRSLSAARASEEPARRAPRAALDRFGDADAEAGIRQVSHTAGAAPLEGSEVAATVNGEAILASDILRRYAGHLEEAEREAPRREVEALKRHLVRRDLQDQIDRTLLLQSLRRKMPEPQIANLKKHIDKLFEGEIARLMKEHGVTTTNELDGVLEKHGVTLAEMRSEFETQRMAMEYVGAVVGRDDDIGRRELLDHYRAHAADYDIPGRVRWQQIAVSHRRFGSKAEAAAVIERIVAELEGGASFDEQARRFSDGPNAKRGGHWDWTTQGSLADREVERWLFSGAIGAVSPIIESKDSFKLVRVVEREAAGRIPFEKVQGEIKEQLMQQVRQDAARELLEKLRRDATIVTMFDERRRD